MLPRSPVFLLLCAPALAAADSADGLFDLSLEQLMDVEVSTATRRHEAIDTAPASMTVFSAEDLRRLGLRWLDELAPYVPGMQAYRRTGNSNSHWSVRLRGSPSDFGNEILVLVDGRPQNNAFNGNLGSSFLRQSLAGFTRIEIIRGPGSAMYGANASYGVINLITGQEPDGLELGAGEFQAGHARLTQDADWRGWRASLGLEYYRDQGDSYERAFDAFGLQGGTGDPLATRQAWLSLEKDAWQAFARGTDNRIEDYYQLGVLTDGINRADFQRWEAGLRVRDLALGGLHLNGSLNTYRNDNDAISRPLPAGVPPIGAVDWLLGVNTNEDGEALSLDLAGEWNETQRWNAGLEYRRADAELVADSNYDVQSFVYLGSIQRQTYALLPDAERRSLGLYAQWQAQWRENLATTLGLRQDRYDDVGSATSPRFALIYSGLTDQTVKLLYGQAFRAPSLSELHLAQNVFIVGNEKLKPITLASHELAWTWTGTAMSLELSAYRLKESERVSLVPLDGRRVRRENTGELQSTGLEWAWRWRLDGDWELAWNGSRVLDWDEDLGSAVGTDKAEAILPKTTMGLSLDGRRGAWSWHLSGQYQGRVALLADTPYWLWRGRLAYRLDERQELALTGSNLLDEDYAYLSDPSGLGRDAQGVLVRDAPQRGRQLMLGWTYRW
ncbi:MAG: TonB-dependent receptor [Gammaproteobacteria bacterium]|nr:TonB-dependent receptor [Gammaproteobacteria bacterium]